MNVARAWGGPVLDLACGTGRLALLLARDGFHVTGIDASVGMLNQFRAALREESEEVRTRVRVERQKMSAFDLGARFNTVICCDAFFHNRTAADQIACLERVHRHLHPGGRLAFNLPNPTPAFILKCETPLETPGGTGFEERGRYSLPDGSGTLLVEQSSQGRVQDQTIITTLQITRYDHQGTIVEQGQSEWTTRYLYRWEAEHLLHRCGFEVLSLVGDYRGGPVRQGGQLIFKAGQK